mmetsp:Transcript_99607/g.155708  ORF Transcript_99607/g.155708 Transcript_99607/m.155708 type:complete len:201 (+) Transcript_99607:1131-1733(+)
MHFLHERVCQGCRNLSLGEDQRPETTRSETLELLLDVGSSLLGITCALFQSLHHNIVRPFYIKHGWGTICCQVVPTQFAGNSLHEHRHTLALRTELVAHQKRVALVLAPHIDHESASHSLPKEVPMVSRSANQCFFVGRRAPESDALSFREQLRQGTLPIRGNNACIRCKASRDSPTGWSTVRISTTSQSPWRQRAGSSL